MPKINIETRKSICEDATSGMSQKAIAKKYNTSRSAHIKKILCWLTVKRHAEKWTSGENHHI